ncbi:hypothetical protein [Brevibacterium sp.]|jgi:hypothetical protein|uniref:hypothetical protein n=1 Tax=Brevibacterium sp. TaxID=1701 RepID=UPI00261D1F13|nr:hypothetical protein [Brevibacterium sp.]
MRTRTIPTIAIAGLLALSGCSGSDEAEQPATEDAQGAETVDQSEQAESEDGSEDAEDADDESETAEASEPADEAEDSKLTLDTGAKTITIHPTDVYCSGEPGNLRHIIGKSNNEPPLVKAEGSDFVMVKIGQGKPYKTDQPGGVDFDDESVTFDGTEVGSATLDGTMTCTDWED